MAQFRASRPSGDSVVGEGRREALSQSGGYTRAHQNALLARTASPLNIADRKKTPFARLLEQFRAEFAETVVSRWEPPPPKPKRRYREGAGRDFVNQACETAARAGVQGVPFMIFADKVAVSGARAPDQLVQAVDKASELAA
jgi:hypothetical protein